MKVITLKVIIDLWRSKLSSDDDDGPLLFQFEKIVLNGHVDNNGK